MTNIIGAYNNNSWEGYLGSSNTLPNTHESPTSTFYALPDEPYTNSTSNPSELHGGTSAFMSRLLASYMNVEAGRTNSILTGVGDDNFLIFRGFQAIAAYGQTSQFQQTLPLIQKQNTEAEDSFASLALPAKGR